MAIIFLLLVIILSLSDAYILTYVIPDWSIWLKILVLLPSIYYFIVLLATLIARSYRHKVLNKLFGMSMCVVVPIFIFTIISLIGNIIVKYVPSIPVSLFYVLGIVAAICWIVVVIYGITTGWNKVKVEDVKIASPKIKKSFDGYRIVHLSDFHLGTYTSTPSTVKLIVDTVNSLNPDLIVFTGDLVNTSASEIDKFKDVLSRMKSRDGVYSVLGNHDFCLYREYKKPYTPIKELSKVVKAQHEIGWNILRNEAVVICRGEDRINVVGVDNAGSKKFPDYSDLPKAVKDISRDDFTILLSHDPSHWRREVLKTDGIDLTLAGHTHAMQFKVGKWSPSQWSYKEWGGLYEHDGRKMYVSTGIGQNIAFRFGIMPRIVLLELESIHNS